jgi:hypothetical protein
MNILINAALHTFINNTEQGNWPVMFYIIYRIVVLINPGYISFFPVAG